MKNSPKPSVFSVSSVVSPSYPKRLIEVDLPIKEITDMPAEVTE